MFLVLLLFAIFGSTFTFGKASLAYAPFLFSLGTRMILAGGLLVAYLYFFNRKRWKFDSRDIFSFMQLMLFHIGITFVLEFWALQYISSAKTCLLFNLSPFITAFFSYFLLGERMSLRKWGGLAIGIVGFLPILLSQAPKEDLFGTFLGISLPELALFGAVTSACYAWILIKYMVKKRGYSPLMLNGFAMLSGGMLIFLCSLVIEGMPSISCCVAPDDTIGLLLAGILKTDFLGPQLFILYILLLIISANIIAYNLYGYLLRYYSATFMAFAGFTTPLFAALWGWLLLDETIGWPFVVSIAITFLGLTIFYGEEKKGCA